MTDLLEKNSLLNQYEKIAYSTKMLNPKREFELLHQFKKNHCQKAKDEIIFAHMRTIFSLARRYSKMNNLNPVDIIHCGVVGVCKSLESFDMNKFKKPGGLLSYYIHRAILIEIGDYYRENLRQFTVSDRTNQHLKMVNDLYKQGKFNDKDESEMIEYIMKELKIVRKHARNLIDLFKPSIYLDAEIKSGEEITDSYLDIICQDKQTADVILIEKEKNEVLMQSLYELPPNHKNILCYKYGVGHEKTHSIQEVSKKYNIPTHQATKIINDSQQKLKYLIQENS